MVVRRTSQLRVLRSPLRQEIIDVVSANGPSSIRELAELLGRPPDALYYHVRQLQRVGLLRGAGHRPTGVRTEEILEVPGRPVALPDRSPDSHQRRAIQAIVASMLRLTARQHAAALEREVARPVRRGRDRWASRVSGWLSAAELRALLNALSGLNGTVQRPKRMNGRRLFAFTFAVLPTPPASRARSRRR